MKKQHPRNIANQAHNHKHCLCSYEVTVPTADEQVFADHVVFGIQAESIKIGFAKFNDLSKIKDVYDALRINYERECGDLIRVEMPDTVYLVVANELAPGFKKTENYKYLGLIEVHDEVVQYLWLHPYLRNKDLMTTFFTWYARNENMLCVQPPVSKQFSSVMQKVQAIIIAEPETMTSQINFTKRYFKKRVPAELVDDMTQEEVLYARRAMETFCAMSSKEDMGMDYDAAVRLACESAKFIYRVEGAKEKMTAMAESNIDVNQMRKILEDYKNYGSERQ